VLSPGRKTPRSTSTRNVMLGGGAAAVALDGSNGIDTSSTSQTQTLLPLADFHKFLGQIQGEQAGTLTRSKALLQNIDPENKGEALSYNRFATYLNDDKKDVLDPAKTGKVYQDMTQPLSH